MPSCSSTRPARSCWSTSPPSSSLDTAGTNCSGSRWRSSSHRPTATPSCVTTRRTSATGDAVGAGANWSASAGTARSSRSRSSLSPLASRRGMLVIFAIRDISARKRAEAERRHLVRERALYAEIARLARHDALTGLPNRTLLYDRLSTAIASATRHRHKLGVAVPGPRPLQACQRLARPRRRGLPAAVGGRPPQRQRATKRYGQPPGRGRVRDPAVGGHAPRGPREGRLEDHGGDHPAAPRRQPRAARDGQHRHRRVSGRRRGRGNADQARGHRDVPREGPRARQLPVLHAGDEHAASSSDGRWKGAFAAR